jgi:2'-5' RNA ligase
MLRNWVGINVVYIITMKTILNTIPGYRVFEYQVVISPHQELWEKIRKIKDEFSETYSSLQAKWGKPHISLVNFTQYEMMEDRIVNRLRTVAMGYPPFKVELKDFGSFPSHTIFINVLSKLPVQGLVRQIRTEAQRLMKLNADHKPHFITEPYIAIARKLQPWQYEKGWLDLSNKHFTGRFIADKMMLLKRAPEEKIYQVVERFEFQNLPVSTKQSELFAGE